MIHKQNEIEKRTNWIDCAKSLAILAVLVDHTNGVLYENEHIAFLSYYSVSLFILISGYLCYNSYTKHKIPYVHQLIKSCKKIALSYFVATV